MNLLDKDQIDQLSEIQARKMLKQLEKTWDLEQPIEKSPLDLDTIDQIANNILWLEDHISRLKQIDHLNAIRQTSS